MAEVERRRADNYAPDAEIPEIFSVAHFTSRVAQAAAEDDLKAAVERCLLDLACQGAMKRIGDGRDEEFEYRDEAVFELSSRPGWPVAQPVNHLLDPGDCFRRHAVGAPVQIVGDGADRRLGE